jgi:hypothetical protein
VNVVVVRDGSNRISLTDRRSVCDADRAEMRERDGIAVGRRDRDRLAVRRHAAGERDRPGGRRSHRRTGGSADGDTTALTSGIRMRRVEGERLLHGPVDGPRPRARRGSKERGENHYEKRRAHTDHHLVVRRENVKPR